MRDRRDQRATKRLRIAMFAVAAAIATSCAPAESSAPTGEEYTSAMEAVCLETAAELDALAEAPGESDHADFALAASTIIAGDAERAREIEPPDEAEQDHRAYIANTDEQASRWEDLAQVAEGDADDLDRLSTEIAQLTLGRDELTDEMGLAACRRSAL